MNGYVTAHSLEEADLIVKQILGRAQFYAVKTPNIIGTSVELIVVLRICQETHVGISAWLATKSIMAANARVSQLEDAGTIMRIAHTWFRLNACLQYLKISAT